MKKVLFRYPYASIAILYAIFIYLSVFVILAFTEKTIELFLVDDGYFNIGKKFIQGEGKLSGQYVGPVLPLLYSWINLFPSGYHAFLRILVALIFTFGNLFLLYKIINYFKFTENKYVKFFTLFFAVFNPSYIHWTLKSTPEIYVTFILMFIIYLLLWYNYNKKNKYLVSLLPLFFVGVFLKPVFILIPFVLLVFHLFQRHKEKKLIYFNIFLFVFSLVTQVLFSEYTKSEGRDSYAVSSTLKPVFLLKAFQETKVLNFGTKIKDTHPEKSNVYIAIKYYDEWEESYYEKYNNKSKYHKFIRFINDNFFIYSASKLLNPIMFFILAATTYETVFNFFFNLSILILFILKVRYDIKIKKRNNYNFGVLISVLIGFSLVYWLAFSYARYSLPVIFVMIPFSLIYLINKIGLRKIKD